MRFYREHQRHSSPQARDGHYLVLGPWDHPGTRDPKQSFGGHRFGEAMMFDAWGLDRDWYDWTMRGGERPTFIKDRVTYFVSGANRWKSAPSLTAIPSQDQVLHLHSNGRADSMYQSGQLLTKPAGEHSYDRYVYDPLDLRKAERPFDFTRHIVDQGEVANTDGDGLVYHSESFTKPTEITGVVRFEAWLEMDVPDTDVYVTLYEIKNDGSSIALTSDRLRARYRESLSKETPVTPGEVNRFDFQRFDYFSRLIAEGSRLRLFIRPGNMQHQQRNYNSGKPVHLETRGDARTATVKLHHGPNHRSRLILPIVGE